MRLDKYLANKKIGSRKEVKEFIEDGNVFVNGRMVSKARMEVDPDNDKIVLKNKEKIRQSYIYLMVNKPKGYICQSKSLRRKTVIDLLSEDFRNKNLSPAGRLDYDTEGLVILTNDGNFLQNIISPQKNIYKKYYAKVDKKLEKSDVEKFARGIYFPDENYTTKKAKLEIINDLECYVYIKEGRYHQVKKMLSLCGKNVIYLKRLAIGSLKLDNKLALGEYRPLSKDEYENLLKEFDSN